MSTKAEQPVLEPATLARLLSLQAQVGPGQDVLGDLVALFRPDAERYLAQIEQADPKTEPEPVLRAVHALKGAALGVGAARVVALCLQAEQAGAEAAVAKSASFRREVSEAIEALEQEAARSQKPSPPSR